MTTVVPSVSTQGWLTIPGEKADRLLSYFFSSEYSQTKSYYGRISSLPFLIASYQNRLDDLKVAISKDLNALMASFFDKVLIEVDVVPDDSSETRYTIKLSAKIIDDEVSYELARVIRIKDSVINKIIKITGG